MGIQAYGDDPLKAHVTRRRHHPLQRWAQARRHGHALCRGVAGWLGGQGLTMRRVAFAGIGISCVHISMRTMLWARRKIAHTK